MAKNILITGGNSGIGYATAVLAKSRNYDVTICGRDTERVASAAEKLGVRSVVADMSDPGQIKALAAYFNNDGLDGLVNNAAMAKFMSIKDHTLDDFDDFFNVNVRGPLLLIQALIPALAKRKGSISNISSAITNNGLPNASLYAASKGAVDSFSRSLAVELAADGIRVNCISPGAIDTPIITKLGLSPEQIGEIKAHHEASIPLRRYGLADEVAHVILSQLEASYVTGSVWSVDGGVDAQ
ncbi:MAG: SDR family oxidoreductase [Gammaproteobacteria bacterium]|nr:SDR family oxidoreductase [Gammaproteobacteria bacterium]